MGFQSLEVDLIETDNKRLLKVKIVHSDLSNMITVSAVAKLSPNPPARVESRKMKCGELGSLNMCILFSLYIIIIITINNNNVISSKDLTKHFLLYA